MATRIVHTPESGRYELFIDDVLAGYSEYVERNGVRDFNHTVTLPEFRGRGVAGEVTEYAMSDTRAAGATVLASCSYVDHYLDSHPEFADLRA